MDGSHTESQRALEIRFKRDIDKTINIFMQQNQQLIKTTVEMQVKPKSFEQCPGRILGIIGGNPSVFQVQQVDIFRFSFMNFRYVL